jgi:hypothetical protein
MRATDIDHVLKKAGKQTMRVAIAPYATLVLFSGFLAEPHNSERGK